MSSVQIIKIDRLAFSRGVDDLITFRPLRQVVGSVLGAAKTVSKGDVVLMQKDNESASVFRDGKKQKPDFKK